MNANHTFVYMSIEPRPCICISLGPKTIIESHYLHWISLESASAVMASSPVAESSAMAFCV